MSGHLKEIIMKSFKASFLLQGTVMISVVSLQMVCKPLVPLTLFYLLESSRSLSEQRVRACALHSRMHSVNTASQDPNVPL